MTAMPSEGEKAPKFSLSRDGGGKVALSDFKGQILVLYFYPRADTAGCTQEAMDFSRLAKAFDKAGASILGVSADAVKALDRFREKHDLSVALGSDESHDMLTAYGVWAKKSMYGRTFMGVIRATFLIGPDGRIAKVWPKSKCRVMQKKSLPQPTGCRAGDRRGHPRYYRPFSIETFAEN